jgi:N-acetyl-beta-hexosaminidase
MKKLLTTIYCGLLISILSTGAQELPVKGFCIAAPRPDRVDEFTQFIDQELAPNNVNMLILRVDWNYQYESHPELSDSDALSRDDVKKLVQKCQANKINLVPQINLLGHQSWAGTAYSLITVYPEFDETPHILMPENYEWPNKDGLYCKSYCPLHPGIHKVVFALIDEICEVFDAEYFHAGMDEVFYIGHDSCSRCAGRDKAELFAGEVNKIRNHLALNGRRLMIWGDRLLDGRTTGMGEWEASYNNTHKAVDLIAKDVFICDWHYERAEQSAVYFAMKGFQVATCPYNKPQVALQQIKDMKGFRSKANTELLPRYQGIIQTIWSDAGSFLDRYYTVKNQHTRETGSIACALTVLEEFSKDPE